MTKNVETKTNLRMGWPGGQNVRTPQESLFMLSRGPQLPYTKNSKIRQKSLILIIRPIYPVRGALLRADYTS